MIRMSLVGLAALGGCAAEEVRTAAAPAEPARVSGYVAEAPQQCIPASLVRERRVADGVLVFEINGGLQYRAAAEGRCDQLVPNAFVRLLPVTDRALPAPRDLCAGDPIRVTAPAPPGIAGVCTVGRFTPYRRSTEPANLSMR